MTSGSRVNDLFNILGVRPYATRIELRNAYLKLAAQYHPDRNPEGEEKFIEISSAYHILTNPECLTQFIDRDDGILTRRDPVDYLQVLAEMINEPIRREAERYRLSKMRKDADIGLNICVDVPVTLENIYLGSKILVKYTRMVLCHECHGVGTTAHQVPCSNCQSTGEVQTTRRKKKKNGRGYMYVQVKSQCTRCSGRGHISQNSTCARCLGEQYVEVQDSIQVKLPKGGPTGGKVRVPKRGHETFGEKNILSDLILLLHLRHHKELHWIPGTSAILARVSITLYEALLGFDRVLVNHLDGRKIKVSHPAGKVIKPGMVKRIPGEGMRFDSDKPAGNLLIEFTVKFPEKLTLTAAKIDQLKSILPTHEPAKPWFQFLRSKENGSLSGHGNSGSSAADEGMVVERTMVDVNDEDMDAGCIPSQDGFCEHCATTPLFDNAQVDNPPNDFFS
ncbi:DnaJ C terminal domain-containing protein [Fennellomyces sp. T-0311]|nr:DnaJ C terminal domain-containing protein [Fennellomyces sp. T-0311]